MRSRYICVALYRRLLYEPRRVSFSFFLSLFPFVESTQRYLRFFVFRPDGFVLLMQRTNDRARWQCQGRTCQCIVRHVIFPNLFSSTDKLKTSFLKTRFSERERGREKEKKERTKIVRRLFFGRNRVSCSGER